MIAEMIKKHFKKRWEGRPDAGCPSLFCSVFFTSRRWFARAIAIAGLLSVFAGVAGAGKIESTEFVVLMGYSNDAASARDSWNELETTDVIVLPDGFDIKVTLAGTGFSAVGPGFEGGHMTEVASGKVCGRVEGFTAQISAAFLGELPDDAKRDPQMRVKINISKISVHAAAVEGAENPQLGFVETTEAKLQSQELKEYFPDGFATVGRYVPLEWSPAGFLSPRGQSSQTRAFTLKEVSSNSYSYDVFALDGFEIRGTVEVLYDSK